MQKTAPSSAAIQPLHSRAKISDTQFSFFTQYLSSRYGLRIPPEKRVLLESRLIGRLNALKMESIEEYIDYTFKSKHSNDEYQFFIEQITTHKTFFFRENYQFDFVSRMLGKYLAGRTASNPLTCWSAGCSTGEEVYTLSMIINERRQEIPQLDFRIVGTDISVPSLKRAARGLFMTELENLPDQYKRKYFLPVQLPDSGVLEFCNEDIKTKIQFGVLNLNNKSYNLPYAFDFVFCRNVTIYFDAATRAEVLRKIVDKIKPGGYLFLGHSETALGTTLPIKSIQPTIYQKL
jgi:chemotaxis protein methyltransferase CheR